MHFFFSSYFKTQLKRLKKKYPLIREDLLGELEKFSIDQAVSIGRSIYKIRIPSSDMKKGKSGGFRSYLYLYLKKDILVPLCVYPKSETESITENELELHLQKSILELLQKPN